MKVVVVGWIVFWFIFFVMPDFSVGHDTAFQSRRKRMYKHLRLTALIMLIALMFTPMSVLVAQVSSPFRCSDCGGEPHIDPTACIQYAHASDCPCNDCVAERESASGILSNIWDRYIRPTIEEVPGAATVLNILEDSFSYDGSYQPWGITGGHGH